MKVKPSFSTVTDTLRKQISTSLKGRRETIPINAAYVIFFLHILLYIIRFLCAIIALDYSILTPHLLYIAFWLCIPPLVFIWGTRYPFYNFRYTKCICLFSVLLSCYMSILSLLYKLLSRIFLPWIMNLPTDEAFTKSSGCAINQSMEKSVFSIDRDVLPSMDIFYDVHVIGDI